MRKRAITIFLLMILIGSTIFFTTNQVRGSEYMILEPSEYAVWEISGFTGGKIRLETQVLESGKTLDIFLFTSNAQYKNYYKNGNISHCYWAAGGWSGMAAPLDDEYLFEFNIPDNHQGKKHYLVFDNTFVRG